MNDMQAALRRVIVFYETLMPATLPGIVDVYAADAVFKDPFNDVGGHAAIVKVFEHMFLRLREPRFVVLEHMGRGDQAFLTWEMRFRFVRWPERPQVIRGATHVRFDGEGKVVLHRDYWDAAEELYEKLPLLGSVMRYLKRSAAR
ncbi:SnoaL-like domain-containing protein [Duganella sp. CF517]|uniref:nuclear transport factor 2 family protein n=1 Tax=Duganella sp. CF517 TaxID=1881038 RepID=UPI0008AC8984|nr:nuclear transport factor 2 family protein [Duganella sp. CF517]SEN60536.1 SnoaL-like domain-containing protein [Duganella sp. CF517]